MFIIIPASLILIAVAGIGIIVYRKLPYLQKLSPEAHPAADSFWTDMAPEVLAMTDQIDVQKYKHTSLVELEKFVRRIRLTFVTIDRWTEEMIKKIRRRHREHKPVAIVQQQESVVEVLPKKTSIQEEAKVREQELIIAIAHDPKNAALYLELGDMYMAMKEFADARDSYQAALKLDPENDKFNRRLSSALEKVASTGDNKA